MFQTRSPRHFLGALLGVTLLLASTSSAFADEKVPAKKDKGPEIDVVLCLDVSGSMSGLIDSAKTKLWDIVNDLSKIQPTPQLRVGLYSYGASRYDPKSGWVRKESDLTTDLDGIYQKLNALTIGGGTELVARVTKAAVEEQKWSDNKKALKLIFVCGNEPADQDKEVTLETVAKSALGKDLIINTIYCGAANNAEANGWKEYAKMAEGRYVSIDQERGKVAIVTPFDKDIEKLSVKINDTYVAYGKEGKDKAENQKAQDLNAAKQPGSGAARGVTKGSNVYKNSEWDLVDRMKEDPKFDITKVPEDQLCDEMKKMKPEERVKYIKEKLAERDKIQKEIAELAKKRADYIKEESKKNATQGEKALDDAIRGTLREQAKSRGITIPE